MKEYRKKVFSGKLLKVYTSQRQLPGGKTGYFEEVNHPGAALIVPFIGDKILFLRQYRGVISRYIWELPAGKLDKNETPLSCAKRELLEETGYSAKHMKKIGFIYTTPGFCDEKIHIFKADCVERKKTKMEKDEVIRVKILGKKKIKELFNKGHIIDSKTIAGLSFLGLI